MLNKNLKNIFSILLFNNRFFEYEYYLKYAKSNGYIITSFIDWFLNYKDADKKILILRHDVDSSPKNARIMFNIERKYNVLSSYYFLWDTVDDNLIDDMRNAGFEVSIHYRTLAKYANKYGIVSKNELTDKSFEEMSRFLFEDIERFRSKYQVDCRTIASHGDPINRKLKISNNILVPPEKYDYYRISFEVYDEYLYNNYIDSHIMDGSIQINYGFSYNNEPISVINQGEKCIVFLAHPCHWRLSLINRGKLFIKLLLGRFKFSTTRTFIRIAK